MLFRKVRVSHFDDKNRLYRVMYVPEDIILDEFARYIMRTFHAVEGHLYEFSRGKHIFGKSEYSGDFPEWSDICESRLLDPGNTYKFVYDFGDWWEFEVRIYKKTEEIETGNRVIVLEGKGAGIWEDNRTGYLALISGDFPEDQSEDDEENEYYMPWNLDLEKAGETFNDIDPEDETDYLNAFRYEAKLASEIIWREFNRLYDTAEDLFIYPGSDGLAWLKVWEEFKMVCQQLKEEGKLPETFEQLCAEQEDFSGDRLPENLADELPEYSLYKELWQIMDELETMFRPDGITEFEIIRGKAEALRGMGRKKEVLAYAKDVSEQYPENYYVKSVLLRAYRLNGKKKEGTDFMKAVLEKEPECTEENYAFYKAAGEFAAYAGNKTLAKKLKDSVEREDQRQMDELEKEFGIYDEYDDGFDDGDEIFTDELAGLAQAVRNHCRRGNKESFEELLDRLEDLAENDGYIFASAINPGENNESISMLIVRDPDGKPFLSLFTEPADVLPPGHSFIVLPVLTMLKECADSDMEGIVFDYHLKEKYSAVLTKEQIRGLLKYFEDHGILDDDGETDDCSWA